MRLPIYDKNGKRTPEILEFDEHIFGDQVHEVVLKEAILMYEARQRVGTHSTKNRAECAGSGRKLWRQKGTGRARVGPLRAPHWRGGGRAKTPKPRDYSYTMPKQARHNALNSAWLAKFRDKEVLVIEDFDIVEPKTKKISNLLISLELNDFRTAVCISEYHRNLWKSIRNIPSVSLDVLARFNPYVLLYNHKILMTKKAFESLVTSKGGTVKSLKRTEVYSNSNT